MVQGSGGGSEYKGIIDCITRVTREEGVGAMFKGLQPRVIWIGLGGGIFFTVLEAAQKLLVPSKRATDVDAKDVHNSK